MNVCAGVHIHSPGLSLREHERVPPEALGYVLHVHMSIYVHLCHCPLLAELFPVSIAGERACVGAGTSEPITALWKEPSCLITRINPVFQHAGLRLSLLSPHCSRRAAHGTRSSFPALKKKKKKISP